MAISILLADDHTMVREGLRLLLESQPDMTVVGEAADGREAVRLTAQLHPDVVIMDITMPELNGIEATRSIREQDSNVKIIILSMHLSSEYAARALRAGALGYVLKTAAGTELIAAVYAVRQGQRYLCQHVKDNLVDACLIRYDDQPEKSPIERLEPPRTRGVAIDRRREIDRGNCRSLIPLP